MDFTYILAAIIAFFVGLLAQLIRMLSRKPWSRTSGAVSLTAALTANGILLLNWSHLLDWGLAFAVLDLSIIAAATVIGFGAIAPYALVRIVRG
jgi:hypothetical protein